jgi:hypothetical protein
LINIYFSESSEDESSVVSSEPPRKRLHSEFTLDGTGNITNTQFIYPSEQYISSSMSQQRMDLVCLFLNASIQEPLAHHSL